MKHSDWDEAMKAALRLSATQPDVAVARLRKLAALSRREARISIGSWHIEQTLGLAATTLASRGQHAAAAKLYRAVARVHQEQFQYYGHALANTCALAALELFAEGQGRRAAPLALEALRYFGQFPEASATHELLAKALQEYQAKRPRKGKRRGV